jgi:hypothetical protein
MADDEVTIVGNGFRRMGAAIVLKRSRARIITARKCGQDLT